VAFPLPPPSLVLMWTLLEPVMEPVPWEALV